MHERVRKLDWMMPGRKTGTTKRLWQEGTLWREVGARFNHPRQSAMDVIPKEGHDPECAQTPSTDATREVCGWAAVLQSGIGDNMPGSVKRYARAP
jgi:hypothetical protein